MHNILNAHLRNELLDSSFGLPLRIEYPMPDAAHVRAAESYFRFCLDDLKSQLARAILKKAIEYRVEVKSEIVLKWAIE